MYAICHSSNKKDLKNIDIYIVDTFGETKQFHKVGTSVFIGGSIINRGGQNPLEATRYNCNVLHGPNVDNFKEIYELFNKHEIAEKIFNENELASKLSMDLNELDKIKIEKVGPILENHELFPEKVNVTFAKEKSKNHFKVLHWERGAGPTKACGTAACATAVAGEINGISKFPTEIEFKLGKIKINMDEQGNVIMEGLVSEIEHIDINL